MKHPSLENAAQQIRSLSTLPQVALSIMQATADPKSSARDLEEIIRGDPPLTAKLLRVVNSAHFGLRERILDIRKAIVFLGFRTVKDLALSASVCDLFQSGETIGNYSRAGLWRRCVGTAVCSKLTAQKLNLDFADNLFSLGILMDLGLIMMDQYLHDSFHEILSHSKLDTSYLHDLEREVLGYTHMDVAGLVGREWKLPAEIISAMSSYHKPRSAPREHHRMLAVLFLASTLCSAQNCGWAPNTLVDPFSFNFALSELNLTKLDVRILLEDLPAELKRSQDLMQLVDA